MHNLCTTFFAGNTLFIFLHVCEKHTLYCHLSGIRLAK